MVTKTFKTVVMNTEPDGARRGQRRCLVPEVCSSSCPGAKTAGTAHTDPPVPAAQPASILCGVRELHSVNVYIGSVDTHRKREVRTRPMDQPRAALVVLPTQPLLLRAFVETVHLGTVLV